MQVVTSYEIMFVNYFWCKGFGRNHRDNGEFFSVDRVSARDDNNPLSDPPSP